MRRAAGSHGVREAVVVTVASGRLELARGGAAVRFPARLLLTPVRRPPLRAPLRARHFHMQRFVPVEAAAAHVPGGTVIIHQARAARRAAPSLSACTAARVWPRAARVRRAATDERTKLGARSAPASALRGARRATS